MYYAMRMDTLYRLIVLAQARLPLRNTGAHQLINNLGQFTASEPFIDPNARHTFLSICLLTKRTLPSA